MAKFYDLTNEQVMALADRLPSATKAQRKEIKIIIGAAGALKEGENLTILEDDIELAGISRFDLCKSVVGGPAGEPIFISRDLAAATVKKFIKFNALIPRAPQPKKGRGKKLRELLGIKDKTA